MTITQIRLTATNTLDKLISVLYNVDDLPKDKQTLLIVLKCYAQLSRFVTVTLEALIVQLEKPEQPPCRKNRRKLLTSNAN